MGNDRWRRRAVALAAAGLLAACEGAWIADIDGDGRADVVALASIDASFAARSADEIQLSVARQAQPGHFLAPERYRFGETPRNLHVTDIDGDGAPDLVLLEFCVGEPTKVWWMKQDRWQRGRFSPPRLLMETAHCVLNVGIGDFDGDGAPDVVVPAPPFGSQAGATVLFQHSFWRGRFLAPFALAIPGAGLDVATGDLDGNGRTDIVLRVRPGQGKEAVTRLGVIHQRPDGTLAPWLELPLPELRLQEDAIHSRLLRVGDLDGDGLNDVIESLWVGGGKLVGLLQGPTKGEFQRLELASSSDDGRWALPPALGDVDGDGLMDIVVASDGPELQVVRQQTRRVFAVAQRLPIAAKASAVAVGDLDGDGRNDLLVLAKAQAFEASGRRFVLMQSGAAPGTFLAPLSID